MVESKHEYCDDCDHLMNEHPLEPHCICGESWDMLEYKCITMMEDEQ